METKYSLPDMEYPFQIQLTGNESGVNWVGKFKYLRPSLGARGRIAAMRSRLNGDLENLDDPEVIDFHHMISHLRHTIIESPQWWKDTVNGYELHDGNVVSDIYNKCMDYEKEWKGKVHGGKAEDVQSGDEAKHTAEKLVEDGGGSTPE